MNAACTLRIPVVGVQMDCKPLVTEILLPPDPKLLAGLIINLLQGFAKATNCPLGADVVDWYANEHGKHVQ